MNNAYTWTHWDWFILIMKKNLCSKALKIPNKIKYFEIGQSLLGATFHYTKRNENRQQYQLTKQSMIVKRKSNIMLFSYQQYTNSNNSIRYHHWIFHHSCTICKTVKWNQSPKKKESQTLNCQTNQSMQQ